MSLAAYSLKHVVITPMLLPLILLAFFVIIPIPTCLLYFSSLRAKEKFIHPLWKLFFRVSLFGIMRSRIVFIDRRTKEQKARSPFGLIIANHRSIIDIPLTMSYLTIPALMKKEVGDIPFFGKMILWAGCIPVSRNDPQSRKLAFLDCCERLRQGHALQYYPEGTRSKTSNPKPYEDIHKPLLYFAFENDIPIIPMGIFGTDKLILKKGLLNPCQNLGLIIEGALYPKNFKTADDFALAAWTLVINAHQELKTIIEP